MKTVQVTTKHNRGTHMKTVQVTTKIAFTVPARYAAVHGDSIVIYMDGVPLLAVVRKDHTEEVETPWVRNDQKVLTDADITFYLDENIGTLDWYRIATAVEKEFKFDGEAPGLSDILQDLTLVLQNSIPVNPYGMPLIPYPFSRGE